MGKGKPHLEFEELNMTEGWEEPEGYPKGMQQKILTSMVLIGMPNNFLTQILWLVK